MDCFTEIIMIRWPCYDMSHSQLFIGSSKSCDVNFPLFAWNPFNLPRVVGWHILHIVQTFLQSSHIPHISISYISYISHSILENIMLEKLEAAKAACLVCLSLLRLTGSFLVLLGPSGLIFTDLHGHYLAL